MFDAHLASANPHLTAMVRPERRLTARQVVRHLSGIMPRHSVDQLHFPIERG
jgi:hypothetical protein